MKTNLSKQIKSLIEASAPKKQELTYGEGDNKFTVGVYPVLRLMDRASMVSEIANGVFTGDANTIDTYHPELLEFMRKYTTLKFFTDLKLPKAVEDLWLFLNYTSVYGDVVAIAGEELGEIFDAADQLINTRRQYLANKTDVNSLFKKIGNALKGLEAKISKEDIDKITEGLKGLPGNVPLQNTIKSLLGSVNA